jgi:hypothetical protein
MRRGLPFLAVKAAAVAGLKATYIVPVPAGSRVPVQVFSASKSVGLVPTK